MVQHKALPRILIFLSIIILGGIFRTFNLTSNPPGFYTDEASIGYNAHTMLLHGFDEHGVFLPIFFKAFGEYKNPFAIYPVVLSIALFGTNAFAVRLTQALWGVGVITLVYFFGKALLNKKTGLLSALILATMPWHIHLSRFIIESHNAFLFFIVTGTLFFIKGTKNNWPWKYLISTTVFFALSFYTYFATRIFTPLYLLGLSVLYRKQIYSLIKEQKEKFLTATLLFLIIIFPFLHHMISGKGFARYKQVALTDVRGDVSLPKKTLKLYFEHILPTFVFISGDSDFPGQTIVRHSVTGIGLLYKWQLPFFIVGLFFSLLHLRTKKNTNTYKFIKIILLMWFLYPLGSVVSNATTPYATRSVIGIIPYTFFASFGLMYVWNIAVKYGKHLFPKSAILFSISLFIVIIFSFYLKRYLWLMEAYKNRAYGYSGFQYGSESIIKYFMKQQKKYDAMILFDGFDGKKAYINFYSLGQCEKCFTEDPYINNSAKKKLIATTKDSIPMLKERYVLNIKKTIHYPDGKEAFFIYEAMGIKNF